MTGKVPNKALSDMCNSRKESSYDNAGKAKSRTRHLCPSAAKFTQLAALKVGWAAVTTMRL